MIINNYKTLIYLLILALICIAYTYSFTLEDAQITYRYALRYAEGYPWGTWNRNELPVEGFTTILWMFILSLFGPDIQTIMHSSKIIGALSSIGLVGLYYQLAIRSESNSIYLIENSVKIKKSAFYTSILCAVSLPLHWYATTGMETSTYVLLINAVLFFPLLSRNITIFSLLCVLLILIRPEGLAFAIASSAFYTLRDRRYRLALVTSLVAVVCVFGFRYLHFGLLMPNTYYAKAGASGFNHIISGLIYFGSFTVSYWFIFLPFLSVPYLLKNKLINFKSESFYFLIFSGFILYFCIIAKSGGDNFSAFPHWRHGLIMLPLIAFSCFYTIFSFNNNSTLNIVKMICLLSFIIPFTFVLPKSQSSFHMYSWIKSPFSFKNEALANPMLLWLKRVNSPGITIATSLAGELPLTIDYNHIDILGLNDPLIAKEGTFDPLGPSDSKSKNSYVIARKPEVIEAYVDPKCVKESDLKCLLEFRSKMTLELLTNDYFVENYLLIDNAPYESFNRAMFIRKDYYQTKAIFNGVEAVNWSVKVPD